jgi:hypothetical protein
MGTLDDAIREHLELKRRSGAVSDEELEEQQSTALGRRQAPPEPTPEPAMEPPPPPLEPSPEPAAVEHAEVIEEPELPPSDPHAGRNGFSGHEAEPASPPEPAPEPRHFFDQDGLGDDSGQPTVRRTRRAEPEPEPEPAAEADAEPPEDFLEETPDFLEETPEHDRLWFEQKPPKDFDFD